MIAKSKFQLEESVFSEGLSSAVVKKKITMMTAWLSLE